MLEANDLGAGLRLAMRDLQIRGAGDMLGANQSGFANSVGLYMYLQMVRDAVREAKGSGPADEGRRPVGVLTPVDLPLSAYIPDEYTGTYAAKLREYQRLVRADSVSAVESVAAGAAATGSANFPIRLQTSFTWPRCGRTPPNWGSIRSPQPAPTW